MSLAGMSIATNIHDDRTDKLSIELPQWNNHRDGDVTRDQQLPQLYSYCSLYGKQMPLPRRLLAGRTRHSMAYYGQKHSRRQPSFI